MNNLNINYSHLEINLRECGSDWFASQCHGLICARLSVLGPSSLSLCLEQIFERTDEETPKLKICKENIKDLFKMTWSQLDGRQSNFEIFLPDHDDLIKDRTASLSQWCDGFLHGIVTGKNTEKLKELLNKEPINIIIKDMVEMTRASVDDSIDDEENEKFYIEIYEYIRVSVQLIYEELTDFRETIKNDIH